MSDPSVQLYCESGHAMARGADWCGECGKPPARPRAPTDSAGRPIAVGDVVSWRGQLYTIRSFGAPTGRCGTRAIEFEEPLHLDGEVPDEIGVDLAHAKQQTICRWCGGDCPRWGADTCPLRPRQLPRNTTEGK